mmetsp:Transcript_9777/g.27651  ORF Transcript_9777/g.27651 Transcript_9777/m.27651 type:complete len:416 (-) Transcript_9777:1065-2312(-)
MGRGPAASASPMNAVAGVLPGALTGGLLGTAPPPGILGAVPGSIPGSLSGGVMGAPVPRTEGAGQISQVIDCPQPAVGRVIGKGGETIKLLQMQSGCRIQIDQNFPEGMPRKITITGMPAQMSQGVHLVKQKIADSGAVGEVSHTQILDCPRNVVGRVIGRGGETINDFQRRSGARIQIDQNVPEGMPCKVTIEGNAQTVDMAVRLINDVMTHGPNHVSQPAYQSTNSSMPGFGGMGAPGGYGGYPPPMQYPPHGMGAPYGYPPQGMGSAGSAPTPGAFMGQPQQPAPSQAHASLPPQLPPAMMQAAMMMQAQQPPPAQQQQQQQPTHLATHQHQQPPHVTMQQQPLMMQQPMMMQQPPTMQQPAMAQAVHTAAYPQMPSASVAKASDWSEHQDGSGNSYWYNATTGQSQWEKPF